jgi:hypothetical protein
MVVEVVAGRAIMAALEGLELIQDRLGPHLLAELEGLAQLPQLQQHLAHQALEVMEEG